MGIQAVRTPFTHDQCVEVLQMVTRECRDLLDLVEASGNRNQIIRDHFATDMSGYGITIEDYLDGISTAEREEIVNDVLAQPEYTPPEAEV